MEKIKDKGQIGEELLSAFFDNNFSKVFSFSKARTKDNAQVADILIWFNRIVFLIEIKTRNDELATADISSWFNSRIVKSIDQLTKNANRIKRKERIYLSNSYYNAELDVEDILLVIGLVILVYNEEYVAFPSEICPEIYKKEIPIHVFTWKDLKKMTQEINTIPDFYHFLRDRYNYVKVYDVATECELNLLAYYKSNDYKLPESKFNFTENAIWDNYLISMKTQIEARQKHNSNSIWIDKLESLFTVQRKMYQGLPLGLYFSWEIASISRRERAFLGEKFKSMEDQFQKGKASRTFAFKNLSTGNWLVFFFSKQTIKLANISLERNVTLKIIKEIHYNSFDNSVYGFGFEVSSIFPYALKGLNGSIIISTDAIFGKYSSTDIQEAIDVWGDNTTYSQKSINEFPEN